MDWHYQWRPMSLQGLWYPDKMGNLKKNLCDPSDINCFKDGIDELSSSSPKALIVPHAGLEYSGKVASYAYQSLIPHLSKYKQILLLAPSHHFRMPGSITLSPFKGAQTLLGDVHFHTKAAERINHETDSKITMPEPHVDVQEHSVEMQLIQIANLFGRRSEEVKVLPLIVGKLNEEQRIAAAEVIIKSFPFDLMIVTTDFSHYGMNYRWGSQISSPVDQTLRDLDQQAFESIQQGTLSQHLTSTKNTICGQEPLLLAPHLLERRGFPGSWHHLAYDRSNSSQSYKDSSVGYLAASFY